MHGSIKHGEGNIMVLGTHLCVGRVYKVAVTLKTNKYFGILMNTMSPSMEDLFGDQMCIFQHDNNPKHTANKVASQCQRSPAHDKQEKNNRINRGHDLLFFACHVRGSVNNQENGFCN